MTTGELGSATVVVPTYRRPRGLARVLEALAAQRDPGVTWDVVIVDNGDDPRVEPPVAEARSTLPVPLRMVSEPEPGATAARARGVAEAPGSITLFIDDDVVPEPGWLGALLAPILAGRADGTAGRVLLDPAVARPSWLDETALGGYLAAYAPGDEERDVRSGEWILTANAAFRSELLRACGGFDPRLGPRRRQPMVNDDVFLLRRFVAAGGRVRYVPAATVVHDLPAERLRRRWLLRRAWAQGRSDWLLEAEEVAARPFGGTGRAGSALREQLSWRWSEGPWHQRVAVHAACDLARAAGWLRQAVPAVAGRVLRRPGASQ